MTRRTPTLRTALPLLALGLLVLGAFGCKKKEGESATGAAAATSDANSSSTSGALPGANAPLGSLPPGEGALDQAKLPEVVADVNGTQVTKTELIRGAQTAQAKVARMGQRASLTADFYKQVLDEIIADHLLQQEAKAAGYSASDTEVAARLAMIKANLPSEEAFKQVLQANGVSEDRFKESLAKGIQVEKYVREKLVPSIQVSDDEARAYYDGNKPQFAVPEQVHVRHILVRYAEGAAPDAKQKAQERAEELLKKLQAGEDFGQLASQSSDDPGTKGRGGDLGWIPRGKVVAAFEKAAFALAKPGDLSPVVETPAGFHIIQLGERKQPSVLQFDEVKGKISHLLQERKALESLRTRVKAMREGGKVKVYI